MTIKKNNFSKPIIVIKNLNQKFERNFNMTSKIFLIVILISTFTNLNSQAQTTSCSITSSANTICPGQTASLCAPTGYYTYQWSNGGTTRCIDVSVAGTYTVTLSNPTRNSGTSGPIDITSTGNTCSKTIAAYPLPSCAVTGSNGFICPGQSVSICGTQGFSSYQWSTGATTSCINTNSPGTYSVVATNSTGCTVTANMVIAANTVASSTITGTNGTLCAGQTAMLCAPSGNSSYSWSNGSTSQCISVNSAGNYAVSVTNGNGCTSSSTQALTLSQIPALAISGSNGSICQGQSATICATPGLANYLWSNGSTSQCITVTSAGTYTVTATNTSGCSATASQTLTTTSLTTSTITGSNGIICQGQQASLCAPSGYSSYLWNTGATSQCLSVNTSGTYSVTAINSGSSSVCGTTANQTISVIPANSCSIVGSSSFCAGGSSQLCATSGMASYSWSNGATSQCITVTVPGSYSVTYVNSSGCSSTCSKNITEKPSPTCNITGNTQICPGGSTELCVTAGMLSYVWDNGARTDFPCITVSSPGNYGVTVIGQNGCSSSCITTITTIQSGTCSITGSDGTICQGQTSTISAPTGYQTYSWSNGQTTRSINVSSPGTYTVTLTNTVSGGTCVSSCSQTIVSNPVTCNITGTSGNICPGQSATLCATPGFSTYAWSTGATTECITINSAGTYSVTASSSNGCTASASQPVVITQSGNCSITGNSSICAGQSTSLCAPAGYSSYLWNTGATTQCITVNSAATYSVTVSNANANGICSSSCSKIITLNNPTPISITGNTTICQGQSITICSPTGFSSYAWNNGETTRCITVNNVGTFTASATDADGCTSSGSHTIQPATPPTISITGNTSICQGQTTTLCAPTGFGSYLWSNGSTSQCLTVNASGSYSVVVSGGTLGQCTVSTSSVVTVNPLPSCSITGNSSFCPGGSTQLCATTGMSSYLWNNGSTSSCMTANAETTYSVTMTDANGCSSTCSKPVTLNNTPPSSISGNNSFCQGTSTQLCGTPGMASYLWSNGGTSQCTVVNTAGTYTVTVTNFQGCTATSNKTVSITPQSTLSITGNSSYCQGGSTQLCATSGFFSYLWSTGATTSCITVNSPGTYTAIGTSSNGCVSNVNKTITMTTPSSCSITGSTNVCPGGSTQLCATANASSYLWSTGATTQCINTGTAGTYSVVITNSNNCASTCSKTVTVSAPSTFAISGNGAVCPGGVIQLCGPPGFTSYSWNNGSTSQCMTAGIAGTYTLNATDALGCLSTSSKTITTGVIPACTISGSSFICQGSTTELCGPPGQASYLWNNGDLTDVACLSVSASGTYAITVTNAAGCVSTCNKTVIVNQLPVVSITGNTAICQSTASAICAPSGFASYQWNNGSTSQCANANTSGNYSVTVVDGNGCTGSGNKQLNIYPCGISLTITPNVCEVIQGTPTPVLFTYVIKNLGTNFSASGSLVDDNGTYSNTSDDILIANWGPLAPGASATYTRTITISSDYTNVAIASGTTGEAPISAVASATITGMSCSCSLSYPDNSNLPRSSVIFSESEVLRSSDPGTTACGTTGGEIKLWYNDEHALTLGVSTVFVKTSSGTSTTYFNVTPSPSTFGCITNPNVGDTISSGDLSGNDVAEGGGRPLWPALFITDLTVNGPTSRAGDWQQGGTGRPPSKVCGTWKSATRTVDKTVNPPRITVTPTADPVKNNWSLGTGSNTPPGGFATLTDEGYGAQISWFVNDLRLIPGHTYRLQFMVHDGDQNKTGGDVGQNCTTIRIPGNSCASTVNVGNLVWSDENQNGLKDASEKGIPNLPVKLYADANNDNIPDGPTIASTSTNATGNYGFANLIPGNYIVGVTLATGDSVVTINGGDPDNDIDNDNNGLTMTGNEVRAKAVTLNIGAEPINDGDGGNGNLTVDFAIRQRVPDSFQKCYTGTSNNAISATQSWTVNTSNQTVTIRTTFSKNFVDNTYGTNAIGWSGGHSFSQLTGFDKLQLNLFDVNNVKKMDFDIDYLSSSSASPSGYMSLGVSGGDGKMYTGSATDIISCMTSLDKNFNELNYNLPTNSPATNSTYTPNANYPNWIYEVWYEVTVKLSAFPAGFGEPVIASIHASPSKTGNNTEPMSKIVCAPARLIAPEAPTTRNINAYVYPNPATSTVHFTFERTENKANTVVELYSLTGSRVAKIFDEEIEPAVLYKIDYNTADLPPGTYTYKIISENKILTGKLIILKE